MRQVVARRALRSAVLALGVSLFGCVDELVVGLRQPLDVADAAPLPLEAEVPWPDAGPEQDAQLADAAPVEDGNITPFDAGSNDAACGSPRCGPSTYGPCDSCDVVVLLGPATRCGNGAPEICWDDGGGTCTMSCPNVASCGKSSDCAADEYCFYPNRDCGAGSLGVCAPRPLQCPELLNAICSCDGISYLNPCKATLAGQDFQNDASAGCQ